ncbi:MAG: ABC transporter permease subunit [Acidimicrobiaceae bacterium]|nr:ABC transporter permease subunit [Acidimicrobiaceae bacterium]MYC40964.1 ABC transporter permease subunit [Acidimicrobiaceae bacterium]MYH87512.1 ABC transporter permease subunit [Acidimicrobiaceae bacterium]
MNAGSTNASANNNGARSSADGTEIHDRGYRKYEGARSGVVGAVRSLVWQTIRSILGLGRPARHKVFPVIVVVIAALPAVVFLGVAILFRDLGDDSLVRYSDLFGFSVAPIMLFAAMVAPEALVRDRRDGMFSLYLSTPLTRTSYVGAKALAVLSVMMIIALGPVLLALVGYTVVGDGPPGVVDWFKVFFRLTAASLVISAVMAAISMAGSSVTDRRAFASVAVILVIFGGAIVSGILIDAAEFSNSSGFLDPMGTAGEMATRILGESPDGGQALSEIDTEVVALGTAAWFAAGAGIVGYKYRKLEAT